ncbi:MAG: MbcA/ParS/Xre antitoxin family protein [Candidatus Methylumidiphilus sp.]
MLPNPRPMGLSSTIFSKEERTGVSRLVFALFDRWELSAVEQAELLGLSAATRSTITRYRNGAPMGENRDTLDRCANLLRIHEALNILLPDGNQTLQAMEWLRLPNRAFNGLAPLELMRSGFEGLTMVRRYTESRVQQ